MNEGVGARCQGLVQRRQRGAARGVLYVVRMYRWRDGYSGVCVCVRVGECVVS